jgi:hypothetical protein
LWALWLVSGCYDCGDIGVSNPSLYKESCLTNSRKLFPGISIPTIVIRPANQNFTAHTSKEIPATNPTWRCIPY